MCLARLRCHCWHKSLLPRPVELNAIVAAALVVDGGSYRHDFVAQAVVTGFMMCQLKTEVAGVFRPLRLITSAKGHEAFYTAHFVAW